MRESREGTLGTILIIFGTMIGLGLLVEGTLA